MSQKSPKTTVFIVLQAVVVLILLVAPFGFDKPSSWGLDFGHILALALLFAVFFLLGIVNACAGKKWKAVLLQVVLALVGLTAAALK